MKTRSTVLAITTLAIFAVSITACGFRKGEIGAKSNPVRFFFMPLKGDEAFKANAPIITKFLEENTGLAIKAIPSPDFLSITRAFENNQADAAFMNTLGYLLARDTVKAEAHLLLMYGDVYKTYRGEIVVRTDGAINSPGDLAGKTIVFSDPFSSSGYLYTLKFLKDHGIKPAKTIFAGSHKKAVEMVYSGAVDAAGTYHSRPSELGQERDARIELLPQYPDVLAKVKIVTLTDEIPNGPVAFRKDLPSDIKTKIIGALMEFARTDNGRRTLGNLYNATGFVTASDYDYDGVEKDVRALGKTVQETIPGAVTYYNTKISPLLGD